LFSGFRLLFAKEIMTLTRGKSIFGVSLGIAFVLSFAVSMPLAEVALDPTVIATLIWTILFFSTIGVHLGSFTVEENQGTYDLLKLATSPTAIFMSKVAANTILMLVIGLVCIPLMVLWLGVDVVVLPTVLLVSIIGCLCLSLSEGFIGYLLSKARVGEVAAPIILLPVVLPILVSLIIITSSVLEKGTISINLVVVIVSLSLAILVASLLFLPMLEEWL